MPPSTIWANKLSTVGCIPVIEAILLSSKGILSINAVVDIYPASWKARMAFPIKATDIKAPIPIVIPKIALSGSFVIIFLISIPIVSTRTKPRRKPDII